MASGFGTHFPLYDGAIESHGLEMNPMGWESHGLEMAAGGKFEFVSQHLTIRLGYIILSIITVKSTQHWRQINIQYTIVLYTIIYHYLNHLHKNLRDFTQPRVFSPFRFFFPKKGSSSPRQPAAVNFILCSFALAFVFTFEFLGVPTKNRWKAEGSLDEPWWRWWRLDLGSVVFFRHQKW